MRSRASRRVTTSGAARSSAGRSSDCGIGKSAAAAHLVHHLEARLRERQDLVGTDGAQGFRRLGGADRRLEAGGAPACGNLAQRGLEARPARGRVALSPLRDVAVIGEEPARSERRGDLVQQVLEVHDVAQRVVRPHHVVAPRRQGKEVEIGAGQAGAVEHRPETVAKLAEHGVRGVEDVETRAGVGPQPPLGQARPAEESRVTEGTAVDEVVEPAAGAVRGKLRRRGGRRRPASSYRHVHPRPAHRVRRDCSAWCPRGRAARRGARRRDAPVAASSPRRSPGTPPRGDAARP